MSTKPEMFGKFILLDKIAVGGMAEVYRAKAPGAGGLGKIIAIKRILPQFSTHKDFIDMFKNEAKIALNLTQANIGQIYEFCEEQRQYYLTMEFIDGKNLRQILSRCTKTQKFFSVEQCVYIITQVAGALDYAHRCTDKNTGTPLNIIHRDMSPQNIMLSYEGEVKIVDFGIAKAESKIENTRTGTLKGKFGYMSPEQAEGMELDARSDIFSAGIVLWELLSGERLFVANNEVNTIKKIRECQIPSLRKINPNIHEELERITNKALARERSLRYQTASELQRDLSRFLYKINPEFSAQDLSLFLKVLFKEEIIEDRKKIAEFAKVQFPDFQDDKTISSPDSAHTVSYTETNDSPKMTQNSLNGPPRNLLLHIGPSETKELKIQVDRGELLKKTLNQAMGSTQFHSNPLNNTNSFRKENLFVKWAPVVLMAAAVTMGGMTFLKDPVKIINWGFSLIKKTKIYEYSQSSVGSKNQQGPPAKVQENGRITFRSLPSGAEINIDGQVVGMTPAEVVLPLNKKVSVSLSREGYLSYNRDYLVSKSIDEFMATLQKTSIGYLNIEVQPSGSDIYINGQKLAEKSPIKKYAVQAGVTLKIVAINPYSNTQDQQTITVKQDTVQKITLFPRKNK